MTMTGSVRSMDSIGANNIEVGQKWMHVVTQKGARRTFQIVSIDGDRALMRCADGTDEVAFGTLLADWVLVAEAEA